MKILDLFCGAGGASQGMAKYGEITGVDIDPQPEYRWKFIQSDALWLGVDFYRRFDFIWASPPCQEYASICAVARSNGKEYPDLVDDTRELLNTVGKPYVIENVPGAPLRRAIQLTGPMFGLKVLRRRFFEISGFRVKQPRKVRAKGDAITVVGESYDLHVAQRAMDIFHISDKHMLSQAVPPAYSDYILSQFLDWGKDSNQITWHEDTKTHRIHFIRDGEKVFETSKAKGMIIVKFLDKTLPGVL